MFADRPQPQIHCDSVPTFTSKGSWRKRLMSLGMRVSCVVRSVSEEFVGADALLRNAGLEHQFLHRLDHSGRSGEVVGRRGEVAHGALEQGPIQEAALAFPR